MKFKLLFFTFFSLLFLRCNFAGDCKNHVVKELENENKTFKIVKFDRGCGTTTGNSIQISIIKADDKLPNEGGNALVIDSKVGLYLERDTSIYFRWVDNNSVEMKCDTDLIFYQKESVVNGIKIIYIKK